MRSVVNPHTIDVAVRLCVMVMPLACWPVMVSRRPGMTIVHFEARATRRENTLGIVAACTPGEAEVLRRAYKMPPGTEDDWALTEDPAMLWVPGELRLPGWPALQGGQELERRRRAGGTLGMELACLKAETIVLPTPTREEVRAQSRRLRERSQAIRQGVPAAGWGVLAERGGGGGMTNRLSEATNRLRA